LPVREINLKACTPVILRQYFILPGLGIEPMQARLITVSGSARTVPMSHRDKAVFWSDKQIKLYSVLNTAAMMMS